MPRTETPLITNTQQETSEYINLRNRLNELTEKNLSSKDCDSLLKCALDLHTKPGYALKDFIKDTKYLSNKNQTTLKYAWLTAVSTVGFALLAASAWSGWYGIFNAKRDPNDDEPSQQNIGVFLSAVAFGSVASLGIIGCGVASGVLFFKRSKSSNLVANAIHQFIEEHAPNQQDISSTGEESFPLV